MRDINVIFQDADDGSSAAMVNGHCVGVIVPWNDPGPYHYAWSFSKEPMRVVLKLSKKLADAKAEFLRHYLEWLQVTTEKEMQTAASAA